MAFLKRLLVSFLRWLLSFVESDPIFSEKDRLIYRYRVSANEHVSADPMTLYKKVMTKWGSIATDVTVATSPSKDNIKQSDSLLATIREIFGVKPYEEGGLTEIETADLLDHFLSWTSSLKKSTKTTMTPRTAPLRNSVPFMGGPPATANTPPSGSSATAESTAPPVP